VRSDNADMEAETPNGHASPPIFTSLAVVLPTTVNLGEQ
jgi:hypothetical protein